MTVIKITKHIYLMALCKNYVDKETGVRGISVVFNNYEARIHFHPVAEEYDVFWKRYYVFRWS